MTVWPTNYYKFWLTPLGSQLSKQALFFHEKVTDFLPSDPCIIKTHHKTISFLHIFSWPSIICKVVKSVQWSFLVGRWRRDGSRPETAKSWKKKQEKASKPQYFSSPRCVEGQPPQKRGHLGFQVYATIGPWRWGFPYNQFHGTCLPLIQFWTEWNGAPFSRVR